MINHDDFYVYAYLRKSDLTPYYIGKGRKKRAYSRSRTVHRPNDKKYIIFLHKNLYNLWAIALERYYIRQYGRKDLDTGILRNRTDGGDGAPCAYQSDETKKKKSIKLKGRKFSDKHKQNLSLAMTGTPKFRSLNHNIKISLSQKNKPRKTVGKNNGNFKGSVLQIDREGNIIKEWSGVPELLKFGFTKDVYYAIRGLQKTHKGYYWKWKNV